MSIFDFPRLHFQGFARIHAPTGHKNGLVDLSTNTVYMNGDRFDHRRPVSEYHEYLKNLGPKFNVEGHWDEDGPFSMAMGWDFGGNGHFAIEASIVSVQRQPGELDQRDPVVSRNIDMWGHYNDYIGTTFNRARIFDCDPASHWTTTIMIGQLTFGRQGASYEVPYMLSAPVEGVQPARWQDFNHIHELSEHCLNNEFKRAAVHQFTISKEAENFLWGEESTLSPTVSLLREAMNQDDVLGLVVQFGLSNMSSPLKPDFPVFWELHGTIGLWRKGELTNYPYGRLLTPHRAAHDLEQTTSRSLSNLTVQVTPQGVSLNMVTAVPCVRRAAKPGPGPIHAIGDKLNLGDLELRTVASQLLVARIPQQAYQRQAYQLTSGIVDVPLAAPFDQLRDEIEHQGLCITVTQSDGQHRVLVEEEEINIQVEQACLFVEFPDWKRSEEHVLEMEVHSFIRGRPASVEAIYLRQFYNPRGLPQLRYAFEHDRRKHEVQALSTLSVSAGIRLRESTGGNSAQTEHTFHFPRSSELDIVHFKPGRKEETGDFASTCVISTDEQGRGWVTLRGAQPGTARILLSDRSNVFPCDPNHPDEAIISYDNDDLLGFWSGIGSCAVRVLTNDWHLEEVEDKAVDFDLIYEHILAYYELAFSFMKAEVFSLADRCKVENYARLMWQMCDPRNKDKTYYMPPTRDMSQPKAMLLRKFLRNQQQIGYVPNSTPVPKRPQRILQTRDDLVIALKHAAELEAAVMLQYIYAAYSIPNYATGQEYVRQGLWTLNQLLLACGDDQEVRNFGIRGVLLDISHEEMIHFLMVNNILMALGEPFYPAMPDFGKLNQRFPIEVDFALEPFSATTLQRFMRFEWPDFLAEDLTNKAASTDEPSVNNLHGYSSLSELYRQIREALKNIPDLILAEKGRVGGEHHLFMRQDFNTVHPDYQLQVDDIDSALFAIDYIVEQGEGCDPKSPKFEQSHFQKFRRLAEALAKEHINDETGCQVPWTPAYPALRNPSLYHQDYHTHIVTIPQTRAVMQIFDECYFLMMQLMVQQFGWMPTGSLRRSKLMNAAIDIMSGMMRPLGELLMTMPSGKRGKTAGPSFQTITLPQYIPTPKVAYQLIARRFEDLTHQARACEAIHSTVCDLFEFYARFFEDLANQPIDAA
uniref:Tjp2 n=1 Tax=Symphyonema bifilamentata 97.28 TaxID=2721247 RepID=A0A6H0DX67_9CYAN|nr:Tjp2 [Symphyonema bifilamentata 97.28]